MNFSIKTTSPSQAQVDLLILYSWRGEKAETLVPNNLKLQSSIKEAMTREQFRGDEGEYVDIYTKGEIEAYKILVVGLGKEEDFDLYKLRKSIAAATKKAKQFKVKKLAFVPHNSWYKKFEPELVGQSMVEGVVLGGYKFLKYKGKEEKEKNIELEDIMFLVTPNKVAGMEKGLGIGKIFSAATIFARDLINEPAAVTTPTYLAKIALDLGKKAAGQIKVKILEKEEVAKMGMGAFLGVAQGSEEPPKFIVLHTKPAGAREKVVVVGKGITFDTGGLSLKPAEHMMTMKMDMSGAATVLALFAGLTHLKPKVEVVGVIAACENMPSGKAVKPGDILTAMNGKTIEVLNTDAEGRLTLADGLSYAVGQKPQAIIDLATLTGACMVALGQEIAGMWGNDEKLNDKVKKASEVVGEKLWHMPLEKEYKPLIKSDIADIKNIQTGKYGGAITAALFLEEFVDKIPWVHLDIAGPAYEESETTLVPKGGAGYGVRTILQYLLDLGK
ncbi:leucyl aminopeptidase [Candidatus Gottesmanbacteria bacterium]|nr:leucyl aminopeptidase [Candidatus Gottesmanbacteria bacterium]